MSEPCDWMPTPLAVAIVRKWLKIELTDEESLAGVSTASLIMMLNPLVTVPLIVEADPDLDTEGQGRFAIELAELAEAEINKRIPPRKAKP